MQRARIGSAVLSAAVGLMLAACAALGDPNTGGVSIINPSATPPGAGTPPAPGEGQATPATPATLPPAADETQAAPPASPTAPASVGLSTLRVALVEVGSGINLPVAITNAGDGSQRLFVVEKTGRVWIVVNGQTGVEPFLDIRDRVGSAASEQGLLGLAFHPDYESNGYFFVYYTDRAGHTQVSRFQVSDDPDRADPDSEEGVLAVDQPASNHNGGQIAFGPDGALWIGLGDGGGAGDTYGNGQNKGTLLGSLLRIDVDELPYSVPADNPFVSEPGARPEIWAYGLRNPWRFSFDLATGDVYIADVGQNTYEEVNVVPASLAGLNYGWPIMEGQHCFGQSRCDQAGLTLPVAEYDHSMGCSVTGGYVYRGQQFPALLGIYFFGDYCSSRVWALARSSGVWQAVEVAPAPGRISTFGQAEDGEVYLAGLDTGTIYHLVGQ